MKTIFYITILNLIYVELVMTAGEASGSGGAGGSRRGRGGSRGRGAGGSGRQTGQKRPSEQIGQGQSSSSGSSGNRAGLEGQQPPSNQGSLVRSSTAPIFQIGLYTDSGRPNKVKCTKCTGTEGLITYSGAGQTSSLNHHYEKYHQSDAELSDALAKKTAEYNRLHDPHLNNYEHVPGTNKYRCLKCSTDKKPKLIQMDSSTRTIKGHTRKVHPETTLENRIEIFRKTEKYLGSNATNNSALQKMHGEIEELSKTLTQRKMARIEQSGQRTLGHGSSREQMQLLNEELTAQIHQQQQQTGQPSSISGRGMFNLNEQSIGQIQHHQQQAGQGSSQQRARLSQMTRAAEQMWPYASGAGQQQQSESQLLVRDIAGQFTGVRTSELARGQQTAQNIRLGSGSISRQQNFAVPSSPGFSDLNVTPEEIASFLGEHPTPSSSQGGHLPSRSISRQIARQTVPASPSAAFGESEAEGARQLYEEDEVQSALQRDLQAAQQIPATQHMMQQLSVSQPQHQQGQLIEQSMAQRVASSGGQQMMQPPPTMSPRPSGNLMSGMLNRMATQTARSSSQADKGKGLADESQTQPQTQRRSSVGAVGAFMGDARRTGIYPTGLPPSIPRRSTQQATQPEQMISFQTGRSATMPRPSRFAQDGATLHTPSYRNAGSGHASLQSLSRGMQYGQVEASRLPSVRPSSNLAMQHQAYGAPGSRHAPSRSLTGALHQTYGAPGSGHAPQAPPTQHQPSRLGSASISRQIAEQSVPAPSLPSFGESMLDIARQLQEEDEVQSAPQRGSGQAPLQSVSVELRQTYAAPGSGHVPQAPSIQNQQSRLGSGSISRQIAAQQSFPVPASPSLAFGESMAEGARQLYEEDEVQSAPQRVSGSGHAPLQSLSRGTQYSHAEASRQHSFPPSSQLAAGGSQFVSVAQSYHHGATFGAAGGTVRPSSFVGTQHGGQGGTFGGEGGSGVGRPSSHSALVPLPESLPPAPTQQQQSHQQSGQQQPPTSDAETSQRNDSNYDRFNY